MKTLKKLATALILLASLGAAPVVVAEVAIQNAPVNLNDMASLQRGAKVFANYCLSCHAADFMRYNRMTDIGLSEEQIEENLVFTSQTVGDTMKVALSTADAKEWLGVAPPDLSVMARAKKEIGASGADYIYTLFHSYYRDNTRPTGWNNLLFPNIGMPNPLWQLQGERKPVMTEVDADSGEEAKFTGDWETVSKGSVSEDEYDRLTTDLAAYMLWMGEPGYKKRIAIGRWVMLFLLLFTVMAWGLNKAYWKDIE